MSDHKGVLYIYSAIWTLLPEPVHPLFEVYMWPAGIYKSHDVMTYISQSTDFVLIIKVKIFVQGRILSSTNGSNSYEDVRLLNQQEYIRAMTYMYISLSANFRLWPIFHG